MKSTRRACLRALGLGAAAAPWLPHLPSHAGQQPSPRRLLLVHFAHGVAYDQWQPPSDGETLALSPVLEPLAPWLPRTTVVEGLSNPIVLDEIGDVHNIGLGTLLTSTALSIDQGAGGHYLPGGPSIDRVIGEGLVAMAEAPPPHATLAFGVRSQGFALSAADRDVPLRAEDDPRAQYQRVFGELALDPDERAERRQTRAELRAFVRRRLDALADALPAEDRDALQRHREAVETLESRALVEHPVPGSCTPPQIPPEIDSPTAPANEDIPTLVETTSELVTAALACDQTRVATIQWGSSGNDGLAHAWQGISADYHSTAHLANAEDPVAHADYAAMNVWYSEQLATLLTRLDAVDEGDGTLLDHTLVVFMSCFSVVHDPRNLPIVLVGGGVPGGRHLRFDGDGVTGLWLALAQHFGLSELTAFGDPAYDDGPLAGIV